MFSVQGVVLRVSGRIDMRADGLQRNITVAHAANGTGASQAPHVQLVALSATLRRPEDFVAWISAARKRPGEIVIRTVRLSPPPPPASGVAFTSGQARAPAHELDSAHVRSSAPRPFLSCAGSSSACCPR